MSNKTSNILCISSWYPNRKSNVHGIFVKRHAKALSIFNPVYVIHPVAINAIKKTELSYHSEHNLSELLVYYPKPNIRIPIVSFFFKWYSYRKAILNGLHYLIKEKKITFSLIWLNVFYPAALGALLVKRKLKIPMMVLEHWTGYLPEDGNYRGFAIRKLTEHTNKNSECIIAVSENLLKNIAKHGLKNNYHVLQNVVDDVFFNFPLQKTKPFQFVHVSSLDEEQKNIELLVKAFRLVKEKNPTVFLKIIGSQSQESKIKALLLKYDLVSKNAVFLGEKTGKDLALEMSDCAALVLSSRYENMPVVIGEAMALGIPIISSDVGGISEHVTAERGILFQSESIESLHEAINEICKGKKFNREEIRAYAAACFNETKVGKELADLVKKYEK